MIPFTRADAQWVIHGFNKHLNLHFRVNSLFHHLSLKWLSENCFSLCLKILFGSEAQSVISMLSPKRGGGTRAYAGHLTFQKNFRSNSPLWGPKIWSNQIKYPPLFGRKASWFKHARFWGADGNRKRTFRVLGPYCLPDFYTYLWWRKDT